MLDATDSGMKIVAHRIFLLALTLVLGACVPLRPIRPLPNFITAALVPGDTVKVVTRDSVESKFVVTEISETSLIGNDHHVAFEDIQELYLRSRDRPIYPCGVGEPLGCSLPKRAYSAAVVETVAEAVWGIPLNMGIHALDDTFYEACVQHDFCYRHGFKTYGVNRESCDNNFLADMREICSFDPGCNLTAFQFFEGVRRKGEPAFRTTDSSYCEYDGPPSVETELSQDKVN